MALLHGFNLVKELKSVPARAAGTHEAKEAVMYLPAYDIEAINALKKQYSADLGLPNDQVLADSKGAFETLVAERATDADFFDEISDPLHPKRKVTDALNGDSVRARAVKQELNGVFSPLPEFEQARDNYNTFAYFFEELCKKVPEEYSTLQLADALSVMCDDARQAIIKQQEKEVHAIENKFTNNTFVQNLQSAGGGYQDSHIETIKTEMLKKLQEAHAEQLNAFDQKTQESKRKFFDAINKEADHKALLRLIGKASPEMNERFKNIRASKSGPVTLSLGQGKDKEVDISGVSLKDLTEIVTNTGSKIKVNGTPGAETFTLELPTRILSPRYYRSLRKTIETDMLVLAQAVRLTGNEYINMNVNIKDQDTALQRGRQAYLACLRAGFEEKPEGKDEDQAQFINIIINGNPMKVDDLFRTEHQMAQLNQVRSKAPERRQAIASDSKHTATDVTDSNRQDMKAALEVVKKKGGLENTSTPQSEIQDELSGNAPTTP